VNSCARGKASPDSCLDLAVLLTPEKFNTLHPAYEHQWDILEKEEQGFSALHKIGKYGNIEPDFIDGNFNPGYHGWTSGPDAFELEIGNHLVYSFPLWQNSARLAQLKTKLLPYYVEILRSERLSMVRSFCLNNLDHIPFFARRSLYFQCFERFYTTYKEFLQGLFIARRIYPIAYDKCICEQIVEMLDLPDFYRHLPPLFEMQHFESLEILNKAEILRSLVEEYTSL
jgi:hypothetical protein